MPFTTDWIPITTHTCPICESTDLEVRHWEDDPEDLEFNRMMSNQNVKLRCNNCTSEFWRHWET